MNGAPAATAPQPAQAVPAQGDVYGNGMEQYGYVDPMAYDQTQYAAATGYEDYTAAYGMFKMTD